MANSATETLVSFPAKPGSAEPVNLYPARSQAFVRTQLAEALQKREGVVVIVGQSGTGKTTLCRSVVRSLDPPIAIAEIVNSFVTIEDVLRQALIDFGAPAAMMPPAFANPHDLILAIGRFLDSMPPGG